MRNIKSKLYFYNVLKLKLNDPNLCNYILINLINNEKKEDEETLSYHIERWNTISSKYFKSIEYNQWNEKIPYSYISNTSKYTNYIIKIDKNIEFFLETGYSAQSRDILIDVISDDIFKSNSDDKLVDSSSKLYIKKWAKDGDDELSLLSEKVNNHTKIYCQSPLNRRFNFQSIYQKKINHT
tara:strand:- start:635 stop:1180 length:546 start_codon:yes stop_codon:yes gene_type:complete